MRKRVKLLLQALLRAKLATAREDCLRVADLKGSASSAPAAVPVSANGSEQQNLRNVAKGRVKEW